MKLNRLEVICLVAFFLLLTWAAAADGQQQSLSQQMIRCTSSPIPIRRRIRRSS